MHEYKRIGYLHTTLSQLRGAAAMLKNMRGEKSGTYLLFILEADPQYLDNNNLKMQELARKVLEYPTPHPTQEELKRYRDIELKKMHKADRKFQTSFDNALLSSVGLSREERRKYKDK